MKTLNSNKCQDHMVIGLPCVLYFINLLAKENELYHGNKINLILLPLFSIQLSYAPVVSAVVTSSELSPYPHVPYTPYPPFSFLAVTIL